ncbi:hypothetical protein HID58_047998 [Brassica napus]|uniref:NPK1-activating kinesin-like protein C-terminal domain-containing protein n=1 Tax=Brassica napus TaxID=3708 RepID=A0ABQ8B0V1_BRANA|nr:hypothetical protein HID58_047998 [Brassica napus]
MSPIRALRREREFLARRINSRLTPKEREELYMKWDVPLEGKQRKLQFVNKLWTDPYDSRHVQESAKIVVKLVGFCESGNISKEMFELNFAMPSDKNTRFLVKFETITIRLPCMILAPVPRPLDSGYNKPQF